jgi:hypothetical protein
MFKERKMAKQQSGGSNKQATQGGESKQSSDAGKSKSGKEAESHTKADTGKGAGGGAKQGRKH